MALVLGVDDNDDGTVTVRVDVAVDSITELVMPKAAYAILGPDAVADAVVRRYSARKATLRGETP